MTIYSLIKKKLEADWRFRERRFREDGLIQLVLEKHNKSNQLFVDTNFLKDFVKDYMSYEREWRAVTSECKELRGNDWSDGKVLADQEKIRRGYESGYHESLAKLETL